MERPGLASSATSSSERMHRLISLFRGVRGSRPAKKGSRESNSSSSDSWRPEALTRAAAVSRELKARSSGILRELPISSRLRELPTSFVPAKDREPFMRMRDTASVVWDCQVRISSRLAEGTSSRQSLLPGSEAANSSSCAMIFVYSKVFNAF